VCVWKEGRKKDFIIISVLAEKLLHKSPVSIMTKGGREELP
jgi:hypothetical protein